MTGTGGTEREERKVGRVDDRDRRGGERRERKVGRVDIILWKKYMTLSLY